MPWVPLDIHYFQDAKIEAAAEEVGTLVVALAPILLAMGVQRGPRASADTTTTELARITKASEEEVWAAIEAGVRSQLFQPMRYHGCPRVHLRTSLRRFGVRPTTTTEMRRKVLETHGRLCGICGQRIAADAELHVDHIIPLARGGAHAVENMQPAHGPCNRRKAAN